MMYLLYKTKYLPNLWSCVTEFLFHSLLQFCFFTIFNAYHFSYFFACNPYNLLLFIWPDLISTLPLCRRESGRGCHVSLYLDTPIAAFVVQLVRTDIINEQCSVWHLVQLHVWWMLILQKSCLVFTQRSSRRLVKPCPIFIAVWFNIFVFLVMKLYILILQLQIIQFYKIYKL
jgi:hypothetical protein